MHTEQPNVSEAGYFHDQKGRYHPPHQMNVDIKPPDEHLAKMQEAESLDRETMTDLLRVLPKIVEDAAAMEKVRSVISASREYMTNRSALSMKMPSGEEDLNDLIGSLVSADQMRRDKHEILIAALKEYHAYVDRKYGEQAADLHIYHGSDKREDIAAWGMALAKNVFTEGSKLEGLLQKR
ncbi:MAG: hypothetical protein V1745_02085 [Patescibacteria group bacterium]